MLFTTKGQGLVEYALILVLIAVVSIIVLQFMGGAVFNLFSTGLYNQLNNVQ
jgi:pilus assembly protein Flp/PilA